MPGNRKSTNTEDCGDYKRFKYSEESLLEAVRDIKEGKMSLSEASRVHNIPKGTLHNKVKTKVPMERKMGPATILTNEEESNVEKWIIRKAKLGSPMHADDVKDSIQKLLMECPRKNPFTDNRPGEKWLASFLRRHPEIVNVDAIDYSKCISVGRTEIDEETEESLPTFLKYSATKDVIEHTIKEERLEIFQEHFKQGTYEIGDDRNLFFLWKTCVLKTTAGGTSNCSSEGSDTTQVPEWGDTEEKEEKEEEDKQLIKLQRLRKRQEKKKEEQKIKEEKEKETSEEMKEREEKKKDQQNIKEEKEKEKPEGMRKREEKKNEENKVKEEKEKEKSEREEIKKTARPKKEKITGEGNEETQGARQCVWKCPECEELFEDPPEKDWIQCSSCSLWWHENCSCCDKKEKFICDRCI